MSIFTQEDNNSLDNIISTRHSIRAFKKETPPKEKIEAVVEAGMKAPFASVSADDIDVFRHFFVVPRESGKLPEIDRLIREQSLADLKELNKEIESDQFISGITAKFLKACGQWLQKREFPDSPKSLIWLLPPNGPVHEGLKDRVLPMSCRICGLRQPRLSLDSVLYHQLRV